jgi:uncharacterized protein YuzE
MTDVYVKLTEGTVAKTRQIHDNVLIDLDDANNFIGVEILGALSVTMDEVVSSLPARSGNHVSGHVAGTVIQTGNIDGGLRL